MHHRLALDRPRRRSLPKTYPLNGQHDQRGDAEHSRAQPPLAHPIADREAAASDIDRGVE
jgi:hypothetical protein